METAVRILLFLIGLTFMALGIWFGLWHCLVGGIVEIINQAKATNTDASAVAWAIVRIIFFEIPLYVGFVLGFLCWKVAADV